MNKTKAHIAIYFWVKYVDTPNKLYEMIYHRIFLTLTWGTQ